MDLHAHVPRDLEEQKQVMRTLLAFGTTGFRNPSETTEITGTHLRDRLARKELVGPRMWTAGRLIDAPGSVWEFAEIAASEDEIRTVVRRQAAQRVDYVKLYTGLAMETRRGTGYYKVPSLKGLWYRGPIEHSGSVATLEDWFDPARLRDDYVPTGFRGLGVKTRALTGHQFGLKLSTQEKAALIAFLRTL